MPGYIIRQEDEDKRRTAKLQRARQRMEEQYRYSTIYDRANEQEFNERDYEDGYRDGYEHAMRNQGSMRDSHEPMVSDSRYGMR